MGSCVKIDPMSLFARIKIRHARLTFAIVGVLLAFVAPIGWGLFTSTGLAADPNSTYVYLTVTAMVVFAAIGYAFGHLYDRINLLAERDDLTGLFNQTAFLRTASFILQLTMRHKEPIAFLMLDIDHFKDVNDNHNHLVGSHVLKELSRIICDSTRKSDLTARFGGDEYVLCLPRTSATDAVIVAERIRAGVEATAFTLRSHTVRVTVSIGIASVDGAPGLDVPRLLETADKALYEAKDLGRNKVVSLRFGG